MSGSICKMGVPRAHAGIDLTRDVAKLGDVWFPRPRGDRPVPAPTPVETPTVPPPTRG